ncbi:MAG: ORF6N domain-containing protein [Bryobacterales bacterium]|nr:ORF6N domain-containing protein [Bryobacterales bacterium]
MTKATAAAKARAIPVEMIQRKIYLIRDKKVMLDTDLAKLYAVETSHLNRAVKRNMERFPEDFMFQLNAEDVEALRCQFGISKRKGRGGRRYFPFVFTEHGVAMLSSVLKSKKAIQLNVLIVRAFISLREMMAGREDLVNRMEALEREQKAQGETLQGLYDYVTSYLVEPEKPRRKYGFPQNAGFPGAE